MSVSTQNIAAAAAAIMSSRYVVAMTGAGMSVESGVPTFRGEGGLWTRHEPPKPNAYQAFLRDPEAWWRRERARSAEAWVVELRRALEAAVPHAGHYALANLEKMGVLKSVVTQNIDGLHQTAGSRRVIELHGSRYKMRCVRCGHKRPRKSLFAHAPPPACERCGGPVKFDSVLFGEPIPPEVLAAGRRETDAADCVIAIGTSASVRPAGGLPRIAHANGALLVEVNPNTSSLTRSCDYVLAGPAGSVLPQLLAWARDDPDGSLALERPTATPFQSA